MEAVGRAMARVVAVVVAAVVAVIYVGEGVVMVTRRSAVATPVAAILRLEAVLAAVDRSHLLSLLLAMGVLVAASSSSLVETLFAPLLFFFAPPSSSSSTASRPARRRSASSSAIVIARRRSWATFKQQWSGPEFQVAGPSYDLPQSMSIRRLA